MHMSKPTISWRSGAIKPFTASGTTSLDLRCPRKDRSRPHRPQSKAISCFCPSNVVATVSDRRAKCKSWRTNHQPVTTEGDAL